MKVAIATLFLVTAASLTSGNGWAQQGTDKPPITATSLPPQAAPATPPAAPVTTPSAQVAGTPAPAAVSPDYVIGPGDSLAISVWKEPTYPVTLPVRPDGMISLPLVGDLPAAPLTPMQLGSQITQKLKQFITDPLVTVTVLGVNSKRIYLIGEVGKVGPMPLTPDVTPLQAIATAGGLTPYANAKHIYILRTVAGKQQKIPFDYKKALKDGNMQGVTLVSGDTIVVP